MTLKFLCVLLVLAVSRLIERPERFRPTDGLTRATAWLNARLGAQAPAGLALWLLLALGGGLIIWLGQQLTSPLLYALWAMLALWLSFGPREWIDEVDRVLAAPDDAARDDATLALTDHQGDRDDVIGATAQRALTARFAPLWWFLWLGPVGALGYRALAAQRGAVGTHSALKLAEWPVAAAMIVGLAIATHADAVIAASRRALAQTGFLDGIVPALQRSLHAVADGREAGADGFSEELLGPQAPLARAVNLLQRALIVWLTVLGLIVVARAL
jgi:AmpE protein